MKVSGGVKKKTRPGNLIDAMPPILALGGKVVSHTSLVTKAMLGQPIGHGKYMDGKINRQNFYNIMFRYIIKI